MGKAKFERNKPHVNVGTIGQVGSQPCRSVSQGVGRMFCLPKTRLALRLVLKEMKGYIGIK